MNKTLRASLSFVAALPSAFSLFSILHGEETFNLKWLDTAFRSIEYFNNYLSHHLLRLPNISITRLESDLITLVGVYATASAISGLSHARSDVKINATIRIVVVLGMYLFLLASFGYDGRIETGLNTMFRTAFLGLAGVTLYNLVCAVADALTLLEFEKLKSEGEKSRWGILVAKSKYAAERFIVGSSVISVWYFFAEMTSENVWLFCVYATLLFLMGANVLFVTQKSYSPVRESSEFGIAAAREEQYFSGIIFGSRLIIIPLLSMVIWLVVVRQAI